jgi:hypothetical protein
MKDEFREGDRINEVAKEKFKIKIKIKIKLTDSSGPHDRQSKRSSGIRQVRERKTSPSSQHLSCSFEGLKIAFEAHKIIIASQTPPAFFFG